MPAPDETASPENAAGFRYRKESHDVCRLATFGLQELILTVSPCDRGAFGLFTGRDVTFTHKTRVAIRRACDLLALAPEDEVLAPGYNCGSELDPLLHAGLSVRLYPVDRMGRIDSDIVEARIGPRTRAIYIIHYFGFPHPDLPDLRSLCDRYGLYLIEDCALSLLSGKRPADGRTGDVAVFCFYKFFPVIGGGAMVVNRDLPGTACPLRPAPTAKIGRQVFQHRLKSVLEESAPGVARALRNCIRNRKRTDEVAKRRDSDLPDMPGHYYFDAALRDRDLDWFTRRALSGQDVAETIRRRRENYAILQALLSGLEGVNLLYPALPADTCPLNMPVLVAQRDVIVRRLASEGLAAIPWWSGYNRHLNWEDAGEARYLKDNLLTLPIHQGLGSVHLRHIADRLIAALRDTR